MEEKKHSFREVTIYIRDDETIEEYMEKARDAYFLEEEMKKLMSEPQTPLGQVLRGLGIITADELETSKKC